jgi:hypothetical protein
MSCEERDKNLNEYIDNEEKVVLVAINTKYGQATLDKLHKKYICEDNPITITITLRAELSGGRTIDMDHTSYRCILKE